MRSATISLKLSDNPFHIAQDDFHFAYLCPMLKRFNDFAAAHLLTDDESPALLALSGGMDSMAMAELFHLSGKAFAVAHVNFCLRGKESDEDQHFVEKQAKDRYGVAFHTIRFDTEKMASERGMSIQETARDLRYGWLKMIAAQYGYTRIATAHHLDDQAETFFINILRGTGIAGLEGIALRRQQLIRPMLFCNRADIENLVQDLKIPFRTDSSNATEKYLRNSIRHRLIPLLNELRPGFSHSVHETIENLQHAGIIYRNAVSKVKGILRITEHGYSINIKQLLKFAPLPTYLFELLKPFGFNKSVVRDIISALDGEAGKQFFSASHRVIVDRENLLITGIHEERGFALAEALIEKADHFTELPVRMVMEKIENSKFYPLNQPDHIALLDYSKLHFPLVVRKWKKGDSFWPFGMYKRKKLSDFFRDEKMSVPEKENTWLLCSGEKIVWVIGRRIDNRFKVTPKTQFIYRVELAED